MTDGARIIPMIKLEADHARLLKELRDRWEDWWPGSIEPSDMDVIGAAIEALYKQRYGDSH